MQLNVTFRKNMYPDYALASGRLELDEERSALLIVDMQNDYIHPDGMFAARKFDLAGARRIIPPIAGAAAACRRAGVKVVYTQTNHREDLADMGRMHREILYLRNGLPVTIGAKVGPAGKKLGGLIRGTWNAEILDELAPRAGDVVMDSKHKFNSFYQTDLELILRNLGIENLLFAGVTGSVCVETTFREAYMRDFRCILLEDCVWERFDEWMEATKRVLSINFGYLTSSAEVIGALRG